MNGPETTADTMATPASEMFRMRRWHCYLLLTIHQAPKVGLATAIVAVGLVTAGFIWSPWAGLAAVGVAGFLMVSVLTLVVIAYGFHTMTGLNMSLHSLSLTREGTVRVQYEDGQTTELPRAEAGRYHIYPGGVLVPFGGKNSGWLWVPPKAFADDWTFRSFLNGIYK